MGSISQNNHIFNFDPPHPVALFVTEVAGPWCQERPMPPGLAAGDLDRVGQKYKSTNFVECRTPPHWKTAFQKPTCTESNLFIYIRNADYGITALLRNRSENV